MLVLLLAEAAARFTDQAEAITKLMTVEQKIGQILLVDMTILNNENRTTQTKLAEQHFLGGLLAGPNCAPNGTAGNIDRFETMSLTKIQKFLMNSTVQNWAKLNSKFEKGVQMTLSDKNKYTFKYFKAIESTHGPSRLVGQPVYPHFVGLANSKNNYLGKAIGAETASFLKSMGFNTLIGPDARLSFTPDWGKTYHSLGQDKDNARQFIRAFVQGASAYQTGKLTGVLTVVQSFVGEGSALFGASQGNALSFNFTQFYQQHISPIRGAIQAKTGAIASSISSVNGMPGAANSFGLQGYLRWKQGFQGVVVSEYDAIKKLQSQGIPTKQFVIPSMQDAIVHLIRSGNDIITVPDLNQFQLTRVIRAIKFAVEQKKLLQERLDQAVARVLKLKLSMDLIQLPKQITQIKQQSHKQYFPTFTSPIDTALRAAKQSLVLLKNQKNLIPLDLSKYKHIFLVGQKLISIARTTTFQLFKNYDNIGMQCGGLTLRQRGFMGNTLFQGQLKKQNNASSVLDAVKARVDPNATIWVPNYRSQSNPADIEVDRTSYKQKLKSNKNNFTQQNSLIIAVVGQVPYSGPQGDVMIPYCFNYLNNSEGCLFYPNQYQALQPTNTTQTSLDSFSAEVVSILKENGKKSIPLVTIQFAGRPSLIQLNQTSAFLAAFLPGTAGGQAVIQAITGEYKLRSGNTSNILGMDWPSSMKDVSGNFPVFGADGRVPRILSPRFSAGSGIQT